MIYIMPLELGLSERVITSPCTVLFLPASELPLSSSLQSMSQQYLLRTTAFLCNCAKERYTTLGGSPSRWFSASTVHYQQLFAPGFVPIETNREKFLSCGSELMLSSLHTVDDLVMSCVYLMFHEVDLYCTLGYLPMQLSELNFID